MWRSLLPKLPFLCSMEDEVGLTVYMPGRCTVKYRACSMSDSLFSIVTTCHTWVSTVYHMDISFRCGGVLKRDDLSLKK